MHIMDSIGSAVCLYQPDVHKLFIVNMWVCVYVCIRPIKSEMRMDHIMTRSRLNTIYIEYADRLARMWIKTEEEKIT